ncbi:MAG: SMC-Scp complex subunit ScpB [Candidatus Omnitrophota bacterium]
MTHSEQSVAHLKQIIEALLFVSESPLPPEEMVALLEDYDPSEVRNAVASLKEDYANSQRSLVIQEVAGGYQMTTSPLYAPWLRKFLKKAHGERLSGPSLETLAIIAYKQPVTRQEIEFIRGVNVEGVLKALLEKGLLRVLGRKEIIGRPLLYGTSREFLEYFGLNSLEELPPIEQFVQQGEAIEASLPQAAGAQETTETVEEQTSLPIKDSHEDDSKEITEQCGSD